MSEKSRWQAALDLFERVSDSVVNVSIDSTLFDSYIRILYASDIEWVCGKAILRYTITDMCLSHEKDEKSREEFSRIRNLFESIDCEKNFKRLEAFLEEERKNPKSSLRVSNDG